MEKQNLLGPAEAGQPLKQPLVPLSVSVGKNVLKRDLLWKLKREILI